ncbi:MAG: hypothetical protein M1396_04990 [Chloroflexi bacterium]|nr:hypothetical protein [Chloroflexota bacterium]
MEIRCGELRYEWVEPWAREKADPDRERVIGWAHPGMATTAQGEIVTCDAHAANIMFFSPEGELRHQFSTTLTEAHGITVTEEDGETFIWVADPGNKQLLEDGHLVRHDGAGQVVKFQADGSVVARLEQPDHPAYVSGRYAPTAVMVHEERFGGNGDIWVADGYGQNYVHRYSHFSRGGSYLGSINEGSAGDFRCPHGLWIDRRGSEPELYIADRTNRRVQVYDLNGRYKRSFGQSFLSSPSCFAVDGEYLIIGELRARLTVVDRYDRLVGYLGANEAACERDGWPNTKASGAPERPKDLEAGTFNSPHGLTADAAGNLYIAEWLIGGRTIKLHKL